jgi:thymidine phosphorylase
MFRLKPLRIDTLSEHVIFINAVAVQAGNLGFRPLDRVRVMGEDSVTGTTHEVTGILNFCEDSLVAPDEIGLSTVTARDLGLPAGAQVRATIAPAPRSVDLVRAKLQGQRLNRTAFDTILADVVQHRYSKVELSMFVLACALRTLDLNELVDYTRALIAAGTQLEIDTEAQMVTSILAKKKTVGATHVLIDIPVGRTARVRSSEAAERLATLFRAVAEQIGLRLEVVITEARGPIGAGIGPRLEALDALAVLQRSPDAPLDLREKSLYLAARLLEMTGTVPSPGGYRAAQQTLDSGVAETALHQIVTAQGAREIPAEASYRGTVAAPADGRIREIDCWEIARVAKRAGAPANVAAGVRLLRTVGQVVIAGEPLFEIHAQSEAQLAFAQAYATEHPEIVRFGF